MPTRYCFRYTIEAVCLHQVHVALDCSSVTQLAGFSLITNCPAQRVYVLVNNSEVLLHCNLLICCRYVQLLWNALLTLAPAFLALMLLVSPIFITHQLPAMTGVMIAGLLTYCVVFAVNSSVHSFLIVK